MRWSQLPAPPKKLLKLNAPNFLSSYHFTVVLSGKTIKFKLIYFLEKTIGCKKYLFRFLYLQRYDCGKVKLSKNKKIKNVPE